MRKRRQQQRQYAATPATSAKECTIRKNAATTSISPTTRRRRKSSIEGYASRALTQVMGLGNAKREWFAASAMDATIRHSTADPFPADHAKLYPTLCQMSRLRHQRERTSLPSLPALSHTRRYWAWVNANLANASQKTKNQTKNK